MAKRASPAFPQSLNEPIVKPLMFPIGDVPGTSQEERDNAYRQRLDELRLEKLVELLEYYEIKPPEKYAWYRLAYCLACDFVPGMKVLDRLPRSRGRPRQKWGLELAHRFYDEIEEIRAERAKISVERAIKIARDRKPADWGKYTAKALETRYYELKKRLAFQETYRGLLADVLPHLFHKK
jgi:hypothetical protein